MAKKKRLISGEKLNSRYHAALRSGHILPVPRMLTLKANFSVYEISAVA